MNTEALHSFTTLPPRRRPKPRQGPLHDPTKDVLPGEGWEPKSDFFKAIWKKAEFELSNPRMKLVCPHCHCDVVMRLSFLGDTKS